MSRRNPSAAEEISIGAILSIVGLVLFFVFLFLMWKLGWWFFAQDVNNESRINRQSQGFQQADHDRMQREIQDVYNETTQIASVDKTDPSQAQAIAAQRFHEVGMICSDASQLTGDSVKIYSDLMKFVTPNCLNGAVNPQSEYAPH